MSRLLISFFVCFSYLGIAQDTYRLSSESVMTISGTSTVSDWTVVANTIKGSMSKTTEAFTEISIAVPITDIKSERGASMDNKMYAALNAQEYPTVYFMARRLKEDILKNGTLSIAGVEKPIQILVKIERGDGRIAISGTHYILLQDFGIEPPTAMFGQIVVGEKVAIAFDLVFYSE